MTKFSVKDVAEKTSENLMSGRIENNMKSIREHFFQYKPRV